MSRTVFEAQTIQTGPFKNLAESLKDMLTEANLECDEKGIKIMSMDSSHSYLVYVNLDGSKFENYKCEKPLVLGLNITYLFKIIRTMDNGEILTLFIEEDNGDELGIKIESEKKNSVTISYLSLMDLNEDDLILPAQEFNSVITLPTSDFAKYCRDMVAISNKMELKSIDNQIIISCKGEFASYKKIITENTSGLSFNKKGAPSEIIQGIFPLKYLVLFTKCNNLCPQIELYFKNNFPLVIRYQIANLGEIKLALAPSNNES
jgi:proliferating cell nuclear antigen